MKARLRTENITQVNDLYLAKQFEALERICNNIHFEKNKRVSNSTATGLTREEAQIVLSDSALKYLAEEESKSIWKRYARLKNGPQKDGDTTS